jgi:hypothetical protein
VGVLENLRDLLNARKRVVIAVDRDASGEYLYIQLTDQLLDHYDMNYITLHLIGRLFSVQCYVNTVIATIVAIVLGNTSNFFPADTVDMIGQGCATGHPPRNIESSE